MNWNVQHIPGEAICELLFVDPLISDIAAILGNLRPGVAAIVLDAARPAARQIAAGVEGCRDLDAVHVIAHGAPGHVDFAAGKWSAATMADNAEDLAAIGRALAADGELRLWTTGSCSSAYFVVPSQAGTQGPNAS